MVKKHVWQTEAFSKNQADLVYKHGPRYLLRIFAALLTSYALYFGSTLKNEFEVVGLEDTEMLKRILTSGDPWFVVCHDGEILPKGFESNLKELGVTRAAIITECNKPLPDSGLSIMQKYKLDPKKRPVAFLAVGGSRTQLDPKLVKNDENGALALQIRKAVAKRFSIRLMKDVTQLRSTCAKLRCVIWGKDSPYFGPRSALQHPKWIHVRLGDGMQVGKRDVNFAVVTWLAQDTRFAIFAETKNSLEDALELLDGDLSFATTKATKLEWEWATQKIVMNTLKKTSSGEPQSQQNKGRSPTMKEARREAKAGETRVSPEPEEPVANKPLDRLPDDPNDDVFESMFDQDNEDDALDLDEM